MSEVERHRKEIERRKRDIEDWTKIAESWEYPGLCYSLYSHSVFVTIEFTNYELDELLIRFKPLNWRRETESYTYDNIALILHHLMELYNFGDEITYFTKDKFESPEEMVKYMKALCTVNSL